MWELEAEHVLATRLFELLQSYPERQAANLQLQLLLLLLSASTTSGTALGGRSGRSGRSSGSSC